VPYLYVSGLLVLLVQFLAEGEEERGEREQRAAQGTGDGRKRASASVKRELNLKTQPGDGLCAYGPDANGMRFVAPSVSVSVN
jgi:hypothetical protein